MKQSQIFVSSFRSINLYIQEIAILIQYNYIKRLMIQYGYNIIKLSYIPKISYNKIYNKALLYLNTTENNIPRKKTQTLTNLIAHFILTTKNKLEKYTKQIKTNINNSILSGFKKLDGIIQGLSGGDLIIIAGRPSTGKTSFAINIAANIIQSINKISIYFFSLEMSNKQILYKLISINTKISVQRVNSYQLNKAEWTKIIETCYQLIDANIYIDDNSNTSIDYIEYTSYISKKNNPMIGIIIIDYLQLIQINLTNKFNRSQELSYITRKLKLLAQTLNISVIVLSQLNRNIETRAEKKPILSDLKESGCIHIFFHTELINCKHNYEISFFNIIPVSRIHKNVMNQIIQLNIFIKYIFCHEINILKKLLITYNHRFICYQNWLEQYFFLENSLLVQKIYSICWPKKYNINYYLINNINFLMYQKSYDICKPQYFHFFCQNILLHNSIEQDSDIIIMIYNQNNNLSNNKSNTTLDFIVCKNRNGPIGSFQLLFMPEITLFQD